MAVSAAMNCPAFSSFKQPMHHSTVLQVTGSDGVAACSAQRLTGLKPRRQPGLRFPSRAWDPLPSSPLWAEFISFSHFPRGTLHLPASRGVLKLSRTLSL